MSADLLLERQTELKSAEAALRQAAAGEGALLLVEGPAGIGKTRFARAVVDSAASLGFAVHWADGDELERGFAYGVLRQLLSSMLKPLSSAARAAALQGPAASAARILTGTALRNDADFGAALAFDYGFYRLLHELAAGCPRLVCVDDAHWADVRSLQALRFASRRSGDLPLVTVLTYRRPEDPERTDLLGRLMTSAGCTRLVLPPLGVDAISELADSVLTEKPDADLAQRLLRRTGGNPFLVRELLIAAQDGEPDAGGSGPADLDQLIPERVVRSIRRRIAAAGKDAGRLADAVAVLGEATVRDASRLAGLAEPDAVAAADRLETAGILAAGISLHFVHPILRQAVRAGIPSAAAALAHARAARLLADAGAPLGRIAAHLLEALPRDDPWAAGTLLTAARREEQRGSAETAVPLLTRAVAEPPPPHQRLEATLALAKAQARTRHPDAATTAYRALELAEGSHGEAAARLQLVRTLGLAGDFQSALDLLGDPKSHPDGLDPDLALQAEAELLGVARLHGATHEHALARLDALAPRAVPARPASVVLLANLALSALERNEPPDRIAGLAELALSQGWLIGEGSFQLIYAVSSLLWLDRLDAAERACRAAVDEARQTGAASLAVLAHALRSRLNLRRGRVPDAAADARVYADLILAEPPSEGIPFARSHLANASLELSELDEAERVLADPSPRERAGDNPYYLDSRGRLCLATGDPAAALENFLACGRVLALRGGVDTPTMFPWRSQAALALVQLGKGERARQLADEELDLATAGGVVGAIGDAMVTVALLEGGDAGLDRIRAAVDLLEDSPRVLIRIRALIELGAMLRRNRQPTQARRPLSSALDMAHHHGATALAERAWEELVVAGGRPRRPALTGLAALTPSERRVAQLVGNGFTNRQVADALFVSPRTVAAHLTHIYQKLGHAGRDELRAYLAESSAWQP